MVTLGELVKYVLDHRKGNAFKGYEEYAIASGIKRASEDGTLLYTVRDDGTVCGIIVCVRDPSQMKMFVQDVLTTEHWSLIAFVRTFLERFPGYKLCALRRCKPVDYDTEKLCNKLMKGTH